MKELVAIQYSLTLTGKHGNMVLPLGGGLCIVYKFGMMERRKYPVSTGYQRRGALIAYKLRINASRDRKFSSKANDQIITLTMLAVIDN